MDLEAWKICDIRCTCADFSSISALGKNLFPSVKLPISHSSTGCNLAGITVIKIHEGNYNFVVYGKITQCLHNLATQFFQIIL